MLTGWQHGVVSATSSRAGVLRGVGSRLTPAAVLVLTLVAASLFVLARWQVAADGDISRFVLAGSDYARGADIAVQPGNGYDGQFSYRLAVAPTALEGRADGVVLDSPLRLQRITYPVLVHVLTLGHAPAVPAALVVVNVLALGLLALLSALYARDVGRAPGAGLLVAGFFGFTTSLGRDLTEIVTAALLVAGLLAWRRDRPWLAVFAFSLAVLSRESALLLYGALAAVQLRRLDLRLLVPPAVFVGWQLLCAAVTGDVPLLSSSGKNLVLPFSDLLPAVGRWTAGAASLQRQDLINLGQLVALGVLVVAAGRSLRHAPGRLQVGWVVALLLVVSLSANVWKGPADFRTAAELHVLSALVLLHGPHRLRVPGAVLGAATLMTVLLRATSL